MVRKGFFTRPQISARDKERSAQLDVAFLPQIAISLLLFVIGCLLNVKTNLEIIEVALESDFITKCECKFKRPTMSLIQNQTF